MDEQRPEGASVSESPGQTPKAGPKKGCYGWVITIVGFAILLSASVKSCERQPGTPSQSTQESGQTSSPTIMIDGEPRAIAIEWQQGGGSFESPKNYQLSGKNFVAPRIDISCEELRNAAFRRPNAIVLTKQIQTWSWMGPQKTFTTSSFEIAIPKDTIPDPVRSLCSTSPSPGTNAEGTAPETSAGSQFKEWGISFTPPAQWQRWPSDKESAAAARALQSVDNATLKVQLIHLAAWSKADESAFMVLTVARERSGVALQLSDLLARCERDDKRAKEYGDATAVNRLEIGEVRGRPCVVHDVTLRGGARMLNYSFVAGPEQVEIQWLFRDAARFAESKPAIDGVLKTLWLGANPPGVGRVPVEHGK